MDDYPRTKKVLEETGITLDEFYELLKNLDEQIRT